MHYNMQSLGLWAVILLSAIAPVNSLPAPVPCPSPLPLQKGKTTLSLPLTDTGIDLPPTSLDLQYITLGRGTQNYTCASDGATPVQIGASAYLYDVTPYARRNEAVVLKSPQYAVYLPLDRVDQFTDAKYGYIGYHEFPTKTTPAFYLSNVGKVIYVQKSAGVPAPPGASLGPDETPAVGWLQLAQSTTFPIASVGLQQVYRVVTAGGSPYTTCNATNYDHSTGLMLIDYAALYYFY